MHGSFPSISVVIPAYNVEKYVEEAVDSAINQTVPFTEIIIVNDGSTDNTAQILFKYAAHENVKILHTKNQGLGLARNEGIGVANSDYIYFFDSDDILEPHFVQTMLDALKIDGSLDLIFFSGTTFFDSDADVVEGHVDDHFIRKIEDCFECGLDAFSALMDATDFCPSACLYVSKRKIWENGLRFMPIIHEDDEVIAKLAAESGPTKVIRASLFRRRVRSGSTMTSTASRKHVQGYFQSFLSTLSVYRNIHYNRHKDALKKRLRDISWLYLHECGRGSIKPNYIETAFMALHSHRIHLPIIFKLLLPSRFVACIKSIKNLGRTVSAQNIRK